MEQNKPETREVDAGASQKNSVASFLRTAAKGVADSIIPTYVSKGDAAGSLAISTASGAVLTTAGIYIIMLRDSIPAPLISVGSAVACTAFGALSLVIAGHAATHLIQVLIRK